jgi:hypothetical protein
MDASQIDKMKALALAATPGPWQWWSSNSVKRVTGADGRDGVVLHAYSFRDGADIACSPSDQAFIAAANPAAVLELIAEVERLRVEAERYRWLRDKSEPGICTFYLSVGQAFKGVKFAPETVDEAIDAAIASLPTALEVAK